MEHSFYLLILQEAFNLGITLVTIIQQYKQKQTHIHATKPITVEINNYRGVNNKLNHPLDASLIDHIVDSDRSRIRTNGKAAEG